MDIQPVEQPERPFVRWVRKQAPYACKTPTPEYKRTSHGLASRIARHMWPWEIREYPGIMRSLGHALGVNRWRVRYLLYRKGTPRPEELNRLADLLTTHAQVSLTLAAECREGARQWVDTRRSGFLSVGKDGKNGRWVPKPKQPSDSTADSSQSEHPPR